MGLVTTRVALSMGRNNVPNSEREPLTTELPRRSSVMRRTDVSVSNKIALRRVKELASTGEGLLLIESW